MNRLSTYLIVTLVALLVAACTTDDLTSASLGAQGAISFDATMEQATVAQGRTATRAEGEINEAAELSNQGGFGVFACYTGLHKYVDSNVHPDFMYNEHVTYDGSLWTYSPLKYWPNGEGEATGVTGNVKHYVSFMAYAPWSDNNDSNPVGFCIPSFSSQGELGNPWLTYRLHPDRTKQVDLLCATPRLDETKPDDNSRLKFTFGHALACVGDQVSILCSTGLENQIKARVVSPITNVKVEVTSLTIEYTLTAKARLVLWNGGGEPNWKTIQSEDPTCTRKVNIITSKTTVFSYSSSANEVRLDPLSGFGVFYIPVELSGYPQTATVSIVYHISTSTSGSAWTDESDRTGTATIILNDPSHSAAYHPGKHLYINISLNAMDISLSAAIAPWQTLAGYNPKEVEGIED